MKTDTFGDITIVADIPAATKLPTPCKCAMLEEWANQGCKRISAERAREIVKGWGVEL